RSTRMTVRASAPRRRAEPRSPERFSATRLLGLCSSQRGLARIALLPSLQTSASEPANTAAGLPGLSDPGSGSRPRFSSTNETINLDFAPSRSLDADPRRSDVAERPLKEGLRVRICGV